MKNLAAASADPAGCPGCPLCLQLWVFQASRARSRCQASGRGTAHSDAGGAGFRLENGVAAPSGQAKRRPWQSHIARFFFCFVLLLFSVFFPPRKGVQSS